MKKKQYLRQLCISSLVLLLFLVGGLGWQSTAYASDESDAVIPDGANVAWIDVETSGDTGSLSGTFGDTTLKFGESPNGAVAEVSDLGQGGEATPLNIASNTSIANARVVVTFADSERNIISEYAAYPVDINSSSENDGNSGTSVQGNQHISVTQVAAQDGDDGDSAADSDNGAIVTNQLARTGTAVASVIFFVLLAFLIGFRLLSKKTVNAGNEQMNEMTSEDLEK